VLTEQEEVSLDTVLTPELIREGDVRAFMRALADARKDMNLSPKDVVNVQVAEEAKDILENLQLSGLKALAFVTAPALTDAPYTAELSIGKVPFTVSLNAA
jgi:hypothetical protein